MQLPNLPKMGEGKRSFLLKPHNIVAPIEKIIPTENRDNRILQIQVIFNLSQKSVEYKINKT